METFRIVLLLRNLRVWVGNCVCLMTKILRLYKVHHPLLLPASIENATLSRAHKQETVSDWLNPFSLGIMSAFGCIEKLA